MASAGTLYISLLRLDVQPLRLLSASHLRAEGAHNGKRIFLLDAPVQNVGSAWTDDSKITLLHTHVITTTVNKHILSFDVSMQHLDGCAMVQR